MFVLNIHILVILAKKIKLKTLSNELLKLFSFDKVVAAHAYMHAYIELNKVSQWYKVHR